MAYLDGARLFLSGSVIVPASIAPNRSPVMAGLALLCGLLLAVTVGLWAHYGTAVFFETLRAGLAACF